MLFFEDGSHGLGHFLGVGELGLVEVGGDRGGDVLEQLLATIGHHHVVVVGLLVVLDKLRLGGGLPELVGQQVLGLVLHHAVPVLQPLICG